MLECLTFISFKFLNPEIGVLILILHMKIESRKINFVAENCFIKFMGVWLKNSHRE